MIFNAVGRVSYFQQLILLKGGSFQLLKLLLKIFSLLLAKNGGMSFQIMMQAIVLVDYLIIQQDSFLFHRFKSIDELVVEAFLVLKLMGKDLVLSGQEQVLFSQNFNLFQQLQIVFSVYQHSSIIQIYDFYNSCKYVIFNLRRGFQFRSYCHTRQLFLDEFNSKFINIQQLVVPIVSLIPDAIQLQSYLLGQQNQQQMIASHKLRTHFPPSNHPILKKETSAYKDQNNYSFSSKPTLRQYQTSQKTSTHKISTHKMKDKPTSSFNNTKDHSLALISKEENIKSIDQRIQAIMKKHSAQKDLHEGRAAAKQSIQSFHTTKQDKAIFEKSKLDYEVARPDSKKYNQIPQCRQSQANNKRNYASANKQVKYSTSKDINSDDLDQKIKLLNERIIKAEQQKKRLNIKFTPFHWQTNTTSQSKIAKQQIEKTRKFSNLQSTIQILQHIKVQTLETKVQPLGRIKRQKSTNQVKTRCKEKIGTQQLKLSEGGQLKSSEKAQRSKQSMDQFLEAIVQQIKWDQAFRNIKIWFTFCNEKAKWDRLKQKLALKARQFNSKELKETFQSSIEQHNPFFKWDTINFEQGLQKLIQAYTISDKHWKTAISKKWGRLALQGAGMKRKIQYDSKSEVIAEQDLVRFINLQKDAFFRNRDLYLIFKRLCGGNSRLTYQKLMEGITREQQ